MRPNSDDLPLVHRFFLQSPFSDWWPGVQWLVARCKVTGGQVYSARWPGVKSLRTRCTVTGGQVYSKRWQVVQSEVARCTVTDGHRFDWNGFFYLKLY